MKTLTPASSLINDHEKMCAQNHLKMVVSEEGTLVLDLTVRFDPQLDCEADINSGS